MEFRPNAIDLLVARSSDQYDADHEIEEVTGRVDNISLTASVTPHSKASLHHETDHAMLKACPHHRVIRRCLEKLHLPLHLQNKIILHSIEQRIRESTPLCKGVTLPVTPIVAALLDGEAMEACSDIDSAACHPLETLDPISLFDKDQYEVEDKAMSASHQLEGHKGWKLLKRKHADEKEEEAPDHYCNESWEGWDTKEQTRVESCNRITYRYGFGRGKRLKGLHDMVYVS